MSKWSGKTRGGIAGYKIFVFVIRYLGIAAAYLLLRFVALYFLVFTDKKGIRYYFRKILGYSKGKTYVSIYRNYCLLGQVLIDKIAFLAGMHDKFTFTLDGKHHLAKMAKDGKGGLLVGAHMGNWEVAGQQLQSFDVPVNIVMLEAEHERIKSYLDSVMVERSIKVIPIKNDFSHLFAVSEALKNNEFVAIHGDRSLPGTQTVAIDFMGEEARFPAGPLYLASKHQVPVSYVITVKDKATHYHFYASQPKLFKYPANLKTRKAEIKDMVTDYACFLEQKLKKYPLQWFNYFHFWEA